MGGSDALSLYCVTATSTVPELLPVISKEMGAWVLVAIVSITCAIGGAIKLGFDTCVLLELIIGIEVIAIVEVL